jgi:hypothetical protein
MPEIISPTIQSFRVPPHRLLWDWWTSLTIYVKLDNKQDDAIIKYQGTTRFGLELRDRAISLLC